MTSNKHPETLRWIGDENGSLELIDQTLLPVELKTITCSDVETVREAIKRLRVRGAPAIGIAAAYGVVIGLQPLFEKDEENNAPEEEVLFDRLDKVARRLAESRPTAVNLSWAIERMKSRAAALRGKTDSHGLLSQLLEEAKAIHEEDRRMCHAIGRHGAELISDGWGVLTHCNAGGLATAEYGTALSVFFTCQDQGKKVHVYVDETRPLLQGARLTAWELQQRKIPATLICDSMAAQVMREGRVKAVLTGADRITACGDAANKIGTYALALLAKAHGLPFYIAAPSSTFDLSIDSGDEIPIEERASEEITHSFGCQTAPEGIAVYNPAFDVTPAELITAIFTEHGIIQPVSRNTIAAMLSSMTPG